MIGQLPPNNLQGGDYDLFNPRKISYLQLLKFIAKHSPKQPKWGLEASQWAEKMHNMPENTVDISTWSSVVQDCAVHAKDPFLRKVLQHLRMFTSDIPSGMKDSFPLS